jgi:hypothetical protein
VSVIHDSTQDLDQAVSPGILGFLNNDSTKSQLGKTDNRTTPRAQATGLSLGPQHPLLTSQGPDDQPTHNPPGHCETRSS